MANSIILLAYRSLVIIFATTPILFNIFFEHSIITSILYVPLFSLIITCLGVALDAKLEKLLNLKEHKQAQVKQSKIKKMEVQQVSKIDGFYHAA